MARLQAEFFAKVYGWMAAGLALTGGVALYTASSPTLLRFIFGTPLVFLGLIIVQLVAVGFLVARIRTWSYSQAQAIFIGYAALNGLTLSVIFLRYTSSSIASTFLTSALMFGVMSVYGYFTKSDLSGWGKLLGMAVIGLFIALVVNIFWHNPVFNLIVSGIGVILFTALTAYDTQKLKGIALENATVSEESSAKASILGALTLYLDFLNLFLFLLRFGGNRR
ncbi:MAG: Bax inhibitor-1/YccA family protein [Hymenobacter sp.]|nr:MAG: Bax inhibitor-1/YccA family protein [Hymenobacter sp.]